MKKKFRVLSFLLVFVLLLASCKSAVNGTFEGKARGHNGEVVLAKLRKNINLVCNQVVFPGDIVKLKKLH